MVLNLKHSVVNTGSTKKNLASKTKDDRSARFIAVIKDRQSLRNKDNPNKNVAGVESIEIPRVSNGKYIEAL